MLKRVVNSINDISDVVITGTPADNEILAYDSGSSSWINQTAPEASIALTDLSDVDTTGVTTGDFIQFNGSSWVDFDLLAADNTWTGANTFTEGVVVDGTIDEIQFRVQGHSTQNANLATLEQSDGTDVFQVANDGTTTIGDGAGGDGLVRYYDAAVLFFTHGIEAATDDWILTEGALGSSQNIMRFNAASNRLEFNDDQRDVDFQISTVDHSDFFVIEAATASDNLIVRGQVRTIQENTLGGYFVAENYHADDPGAGLICRGARGTEASPTASLSGGVIATVVGQGSEDTVPTWANGALIRSYTTENWSASAHGCDWQFHTTPNGSTTPTLAFTLEQDQTANFAAGQKVAVETITATSDTLDGSNHVVLVDDDTAGSAVTITLPAAASHSNRVYEIKKLGTTASVTVDGNASETIDGGTTAVLTTQYESITIVCDGSNWHILA